MAKARARGGQSGLPPATQFPSYAPRQPTCAPCPLRAAAWTVRWSRARRLFRSGGRAHARAASTARRCAQGIWSAPLIDNPAFVDDPALYVFPATKYLGFELWQVKAGSIFDNVLLTDSLDEALQFARDTWGATIKGEQAMAEAAEARRLFPPPRSRCRGRDLKRSAATSGPGARASRRGFH